MSNSRAPVLLLLVAVLAGCGESHKYPTPPANQAPVARLTITPSSGPAPLSVTVSGAASTDADGTIASYAWTFGDGTSATGTSAEHSYAVVGEYTVTLTVTDDEGATGRATASAVATGPTAVYNGSVFDGANYQGEPTSGTYDTTTLQ